ncbi:MAG: TonB-dependent receptor [Woeseiaceae bacterium]|nr:TonB-dependent receptor [Woeseiaceae bacterium]
MKRKQEQNDRSSSLAITLCGLAVCLAAPLAQAQDDALEEIIVKGKRGSLLQSLDQKRNATSIVDSIASEELGRFPDPNVADSLSHVPGVTVSRTRDGEAQYVNIRGLGPEFSVVTLNGRILATDDEGRNFAFDVFPSEMISGADVWKSADARKTEGSIGGLIDLKSTRPLDIPGFHSSVTATGDYNTLSEESGTKFNGIVSNTFADDTFGVIFGFTSAQGDRRSDDMFDNFFFGPDDGAEYDLNANGAIEANEQGLVIPGSYALGAYATDFKRTGITTTLQYKPSDRLVLTADALVTKLESNAVGYTQSFYMEADPTGGRFTNFVMDGNVMTATDVADVTMEVVTLDEHRTVDTNMIGFNGVFDVSDRLAINADVYWSESVRDGGGKDTFVVAGSPGSHTGRFSLNNGGLPDYVPTWDGGMSSDDFGNNEFAPHWAERYGDDIEDQVVGVGLGANLVLDLAFADEADLDFGIAFTGREKSKMSLDNEELGACNYCDYPYFFGDVGADVVRPFPYNDLFSGDGANVPRSFPIFDIPAYAGGLAASDGLTLTDYNGNVRTFEANESALWAPIPNPVNSYEITEDTTALYVQLNLNDERWYANLGLRYVQTDATSEYAYNSIESITIIGEGTPNPSWDVVRSASSSQSAKGDYSKVLPALNYGIDLKEDVKLRLSASQTMSRPTLNQMAPLTTDDAASGVFVMDISGDPGIEPVFADNFDASIEWYFDEGSLLSAAVFWKELEGFITTDTTSEMIAGENFRVTRAINGDTAEVTGIELGFSKIFDNGFGIAASLTSTDSKTIVDGADTGGLVGVPDQSYSLTGFYETEIISAHISFDHTGDSVDDPYSPLGEGYVTTREEYDMMTASFRYHWNENLTVFMEGFNLMDAINETYVGRPDLPASIQYSGRTFNFGAVYTF